MEEEEEKEAGEAEEEEEEEYGKQKKTTYNSVWCSDVHQTLLYVGFFGFFGWGSHQTLLYVGFFCFSGFPEAMGGGVVSQGSQKNQKNKRIAVFGGRQSTKHCYTLVFFLFFLVGPR